MLSHKNRFHGHGSLRYLYRNGTQIRTKDFGLTYIKNEKRVHSRFAVVVSKKVFKSAVKRNILRRRIYEIIRLEMSRIKSPYDVVITVFTQETIDKDPKKLYKLVADLLAKDNLIN